MMTNRRTTILDKADSAARRPVLMLFAGAALVAAGAVTVAAMSGGGGARDVTIPAGTKIVAALQNDVSTETTNAGDWIEVRTVNSLRLNQSTVLPSGMILKGEVTESKGGGRISSSPELTIQYRRLEIQGREFDIVADRFQVRGKSERKKDVKRTVGGAVVGGVVGAITGNTKRGILIGTAVGAGVAVATKGGHIVLPAGQQLQIRLAEPVAVSYRSDIAHYPPR